MSYISKNTQLISFQETYGVITKKTTFNLIPYSTVAPVESWGGKKVDQDIYFQINNLYSQKNESNFMNYKMSSLKVREANGRKILYNGQEYDSLELLNGDDNLKYPNAYFQIKRKNNDYGKVSLKFEYKWYKESYTSNEYNIGFFLREKDITFSSENTSVKFYDVYNLVSGNKCYYNLNGNEYNSIFYDGLIFEKTILTLSEEELYIPKKEIEVELYLTTVEGVNKEIKISLNTNFYKNSQYIFSSELHLSKTSFFEQLFNDSIVPIKISYKINKQFSYDSYKEQNAVFIYFCENPNIDIVEEDSQEGKYFQVGIKLNNTEEKVYNCNGTFSFKNHLNDNIDVMEYFFYGFGFYYNFDCGITNNKMYTNLPCWFYLYQDNNLKNQGVDFEKEFYKREETDYDQNQNKSRTNPLPLKFQNTYYLFKKYGSNLSGIEIVINAKASSIDTTLPQYNWFFKYQRDNEVSLISKKEVCFLTKFSYNNIEDIRKKLIVRETDQELSDYIINRKISTTNKIHGVSILTNYDKISLNFEGGIYNYNSAIISDFFVNLVERDANNNQLIKKTKITNKQIEGGIEPLQSFLNSSPTILISNILKTISYDRLYSFEISITVQNLKEKKTFMKESCYWIPFYYSFSFIPLIKEYKPYWISKTYNSKTDKDRKGVFKIKENNEEKIVQKLNLEEANNKDYFECVDINDINKSSPYYDEKNNIFYENFTNIKCQYKIKINDYFKSKYLENDTENFIYNDLLEILKDQNQKIVHFAENLGSSPIYYRQGILDEDQWLQITGAAFNYTETIGLLISIKDFAYSSDNIFPENISSLDEIPSELILNIYISSPLSKIKLGSIDPYKPLYFRIDTQSTYNTLKYIEWQYPPLGNVPTIAYRKNKIGINTLAIDEEDDDSVISIKQVNDNTKYIKLYNTDNELVMTIDLSSGAIENTTLNNSTIENATLNGGTINRNTKIFSSDGTASITLGKIADSFLLTTN